MSNSNSSNEIPMEFVEAIFKTLPDPEKYDHSLIAKIIEEEIASKEHAAPYVPKKKN